MGCPPQVTPLVLDTHAWVWWLTKPEALTRTQRTAVERAVKHGGDSLLVSTLSCWEVALLVQHRRLRFSLPIERWLDQATTIPGLTVVPLSLPIIASAARLTILRDPADMLIVATAQHHGARLATSDVRIQEADLVSIVA